MTYLFGNERVFLLDPMTESLGITVEKGEKKMLMTSKQNFIVPVKCEYMPSIQTSLKLCLAGEKAKKKRSIDNVPNGVMGHILLPQCFPVY